MEGAKGARRVSERDKDEFRRGERMEWDVPSPSSPPAAATCSPRGRSWSIQSKRRRQLPTDPSREEGSPRCPHGRVGPAKSKTSRGRVSGSVREKTQRRDATNLEVDGERRDLLGETEEVDGGIEQSGLELGLEIDGSATVTCQERRESAREKREETGSRSQVELTPPSTWTGSSCRAARQCGWRTGGGSRGGCIG